MRRNFKAGNAQNGLRLNVFTPDELADIHRGTLHVLNETGLFVGTAEAQEVFRKAGCRVDADNGMVKIPHHVIEDAILSCPETIILKGRTKDKDVVVEDGRLGFANFGEAVNVADFETGEIRKTRKSDVCDMARLLDALDAVDLMSRPAGCHDKAEHISAIHNYHALITNSTKHVMIGVSESYQCKKIQEIAKIVIKSIYGEKEAEERMPVSFLVCPLSPLKLIPECCDVIMHAAETRTAVVNISMVMSGASGPVNLAGALVTQNAEVLGAITLGQLVNRGTPALYGSTSTAFDLKNASGTCGSAEMGLISAAAATMARYYMLPSWVAGA